MSGAVIPGPWAASGRRTRSRQRVAPPAAPEPSDRELLELGRAFHGFIRDKDYYGLGQLWGTLEEREQVRRRRPLIFAVPLLVATETDAAG